MIAGWLRSLWFVPFWREAWKSPSFRLFAPITAVLLPLTLRWLTTFLNQVEARPGIVLPDPLLSLFQARDLTWLTFGIIYIGLFAGIILLLRHPHRLILAVQTYILMVVFRIIAMSLVPLEQPAGAIPLQDPLVQIVGTGQLLTKDLFFSGHTATLFLLGLCMQGYRLRMAYFSAALGVAICVLLQHDHYSIDVFAAPFFSYGAFRIAAALPSLIVRMSGQLAEKRKGGIPGSAERGDRVPRGSTPQA